MGIGVVVVKKCYCVLGVVDVVFMQILSRDGDEFVLVVCCIGGFGELLDLIVLKYVFFFIYYMFDEGFEVIVIINWYLVGKLCCILDIVVVILLFLFGMFGKLQ